MRLFIAISFSEKIKELIYNEEKKLESKMTHGHITEKNNIHLTNIFIGEVNNPKNVSDVLDKINMESFDILIKGLNYFNRGDSRLYYLDIKNNENLVNIYNFLYDELIKKGYNIEYKDYKPHVTLAREVKLSDNVVIKDLNLLYKVTKISLMESKRINGELKYIEIFSKNLK